MGNVNFSILTEQLNLKITSSTNYNLAINHISLDFLSPYHEDIKLWLMTDLYFGT